MFCATTMVRLKPFSRYFVGERIRKMAFLLLVFSCLPQGFWESILVMLVIEALKEEG